MSKKSLKILLVLVTILSLISTFSLATDTTTEDPSAVTTSTDDATVTTTDEAGTDDTVVTSEDGYEEESTEASTNHDVYLSGDSVTIEDSETINGNAFVFAKTVTINGQIGGDLFVIADTLNIDGGQIYGNVFTLSTNITLNGLIYDLYAICDTLTVSYDGVAYRDLKVTCDTANINGVIGKDVDITAKQSLSLEADCIIYGDLNYSASNEISIADGLVSGNVNYTKLSAVESTNSVSDYILSALMVLVYTLVIWLLMSKLAPKFYGKINDMPVKKMLIAILIGLVSIIIVPIVALLLMMTVVGVPVAFALIAIFALILSVSFATASIGIANKLAEKVKALAKFNNLFAVIIITLVLWALTQIPYAGAVISLLITLCGFGMFLSSIINKKEKKVEAKAE